MNGVVTTPHLKPLRAGRELHIIACEREAARRCIGVRWASLPALGFPISGYRISRMNVRRDDRADPFVLGTFFLPRTGAWAEFEHDALARQQPCGPTLSDVTEENLGFLLPLIRLVDPRTDPAEHSALTTQAADFFGPAHENDAELAWNIWGQATPPPLAELLADPATAPLLIAFYQRTASAFLLTLALRFEYAALLGLGMDDPHAIDNGTVAYGVEADWGAVSGSAASRNVAEGQCCAPPPPSWANAERVPGTIPHRAFQSWPGWVAPIEMAPVTASGDPLPLRAPRGPAAFTALDWAAPPPETDLIGYGPVLYEVQRHSFGAASASQLTRPMLPAGALFQTVIPGDLTVRSENKPQFLDLPGMDWPPLEGWFGYHVIGVDLLGTRSAPSPVASLRHHDDFAPPAPPATLLAAQALTFAPTVTTVAVPVRIDWNAGQDFGGQDVVEFRVAATWVPLTTVPVHIETSIDIDSLHADLTLSTLPGAADRYGGISLSVPGADFPIVSHGTGVGAAMRVRKRRGVIPAAGSDGAIYAPGTATPLTRVARLARQPAVAGTVRTVPSTNPLEIAADPAGTAALPNDAEISIYVHLLRASFTAKKLAAGRWALVEPPPGQPAAEALAKWRALPGPEALLIGSPLLLFPPHSLDVQVPIPPSFVGGLLVLGVSAADGASYVESPVLPVADPSLAAPRGNESPRSELAISVRSLAPLPAVSVALWDPNVRTWATSASDFVESATCELSWTAMPGAARYEVWRVPEGALTGVTPSTSDLALRSAAEAQPSRFELRADQIFANRYTDALPGRAPTRALYKVRAVSIAGVPGDWSPVIGPIYVPDVRRPAAPNLLRFAPARQDEADRALVAEWTFSGPADGVRFDVYSRIAGGSDPFLFAGSVPKNTAPDPTGRFRWLVSGRIPGRRYACQIVAVREALDPIDPAAAVTRDIAGLPSVEVTGVAISYGPLLGPSSITAALGATPGSVAIAWTNNDSYESIEVWRRSATSILYVRCAAALAGDAIACPDTPGAGQWIYQVRGCGVRRQANGANEPEITVP